MQCVNSCIGSESDSDQSTLSGKFWTLAQLHSVGEQQGQQQHMDVEQAKGKGLATALCQVLTELRDPEVAQLQQLTNPEGSAIRWSLSHDGSN